MINIYRINAILNYMPKKVEIKLQLTAVEVQLDYPTLVGLFLRSY